MSYQQKLYKYESKNQAGGAVAPGPVANFNILDPVNVVTPIGAYHVGVFRLNNNQFQGNRGIGNAFPALGYILSIKRGLDNNIYYDILTYDNNIIEYPIKIYYNLDETVLERYNIDIPPVLPNILVENRDLLNNLIMNNVFTLNHDADRFFF